MKIETQRRIENLMFAMQLTIVSLDDLKQDSFYSKEIKLHGNRLLESLERIYSQAFNNATGKATDYYIRLNDWQKIGADTFPKFDSLSEEGKLRYLSALANFNTINLREK